MNTKKITYILILIFVFSLGFYTTASAASYVSLISSFSAKNLRLQKFETIGPHGCPIRLGDSLETCDIEPGDFMRADGTLQWGSGFLSPLPAMGMGGFGYVGGPPLGYIPPGYNGIYCAAGSSDFGTGPGASSQDGKICEITFNNSNPGTGSAWYYVYAEPTATRGSKYLMGLASNGGSNTLQTNFYIRVKPLDICVINSFTCSASTLSWDTSSSCTSRTINNGVGNVGVSGSANVSIGIYELTVSNGETGDFSSAACDGGATLTASWNATGNSYTTLPVTSGQTFSIPFTFRKSGSGSLKFQGCGVSSANIPQNQITVSCLTPVGAEISY